MVVVVVVVVVVATKVTIYAYGVYDVTCTHLAGGCLLSHLSG